MQIDKVVTSGKFRLDGVTTILTTHLMDEAEALADRVVIIDHGHMVARRWCLEPPCVSDQR